MTTLPVPRSVWAPLPGSHYLHPQVTSRVPRRFLFWDTEAVITAKDGGQAHTWRCGVTGAVRWREGSRTWPEPVLARHGAPEALWEAVTAFARRDARTVVVAHKLAYDLRIADGFHHLIGLGWAIERPTLSGDHIGFEAVQGDRRLIFVDSLNVFPVRLATLGEALGLVKPDLPDQDAPAEVWWDRCEADVKILARAYMALVAWLDAEDLGGWARSGSGIGWHTMLRRHLVDKVLVHNRDEVREAEAAAMYAGRAEVWRHGPQHKGPYIEWDFATAYGHVCATTELPAVLECQVTGASLEGMRRAWPAAHHLVEARVSTEVPALPHRDATGIFWPVGTFSGWWWDTELVMAAEAGAEVRPLRAWRYRCSPWLASWAQWAIGLVGDKSTPEAVIKGLAAKHWLRSVPGRSAMRFATWGHAGAAYVPGVAYTPLLDHDSGARGKMLTLGAERFEAWESSWWDNALPQVLSYVMAVCRTRLWRAMTIAGLENLVYVDTDCLITNRAGTNRVRPAADIGALWGLREKGRHASLDPIAPKLVRDSTYRRLVGVPRGAMADEHGEYDAEVWEGMLPALSFGRTDQVVVRPMHFVLSGVDTTRVHLPGGGTEPFRVEDGVRVQRAKEAS